VRVEALIDEVSQEPPRLRDAEANAPADRKEAGRVVLGVRHHVPHRGQTDADHDRVARAVDELVELTRLEASGARDPRLAVDEPPLISWHDAAGRQASITFGQPVVAVL